MKRDTTKDRYKLWFSYSPTVQFSMDFYGDLMEVCAAAEVIAKKLGAVFDYNQIKDN